MLSIKKFNLISILTTIIIYVIISGYSGGANGLAGLGAGTGCGGANCHGLASGTTFLNFTTNIPVTGYIPGTTYTIDAVINNTGKTHAGFNVNVNHGTITAGTNMQLSGNKDVTHLQPQAMVLGQATFTFTWTASNAATTAFAFAGNAVNNNGQTSGDAWFQLPFSFTKDSNYLAKPEIINYSVNTITPNTATIYSTIDSKGLSTAPYVQYGNTTAITLNASVTPTNFTNTSNCTAVLTGLVPNTTYYYKVFAGNNDGIVATTLDSFTTPFYSNVNSYNNQFIKCYPTPCKDQLMVTLNESDNIVIWNLMGATVYQSVL